MLPRGLDSYFPPCQSYARRVGISQTFAPTGQPPLVQLISPDLKLQLPLNALIFQESRFHRESPLHWNPPRPSPATQEREPWTSVSQGLLGALGGLGICPLIGVSKPLSRAPEPTSTWGRELLLSLLPFLPLLSLFLPSSGSSVFPLKTHHYLNKSITLPQYPPQGAFLENVVHLAVTLSSAETQQR